MKASIAQHRRAVAAWRGRPLLPTCRATHITVLVRLQQHTSLTVGFSEKPSWRRPKRASTHWLSTGLKATSTPVALASTAMAAAMASTRLGSHDDPCVTSSGKTVPPWVAECSASWLKLAGMPRREPFTRVDWITFRAATSAAGDAEPAFPVAGLTESTVGAGAGEGG